MDMGSLDRRSVLFLIGGLAVLAILRFGVYGDNTPQTVAAAAESIPMAERRLERLRQISATVPGKEELLKKAQAELNGREQGVLKADTEAQAQAQLLEITQSIARLNGIDARGMQEQNGKAISDDYGEIWTAVTFTCDIVQLVNFLSALGNQPQILATNDIHIAGGNDKKKNVQVRLSVSAIVPRRLIPKKALNAL